MNMAMLLPVILRKMTVDKSKGRFARSIPDNLFWVKNKKTQLKKRAYCSFLFFLWRNKNLTFALSWCHFCSMRGTMKVILHKINLKIRANETRPTGV